MKINQLLRNVHDRIMLTIGKKFVLNINTYEIHTLTIPNCHAMSNMKNKNKKYLTLKEKISYLKRTDRNYNGCRFCLKKHNNG